MTQQKPISGLVAQIVNERELAINIGAEQGVKAGMTFAVLAESPLVIRDPITDEELGREDRPKVNVKAERVHPKFTICKTFRILSGSSSYLSSINRTLAATQMAVGDMLGEADRPETLSARKESLPKPLSPEESFVKPGDRVVQTFGID